MRLAMTRSCCALVLVACLAVLGSAPAAHAQSGAEMDQARELFRTGLDSARQGRWEEARDAFERSLAIVERPSTLLNLAGAQAQTGRLVAAAESYRRFLQRDDVERYRAEAESALHAVEARIARLTIATVGVDDGDEVRLDEAVLAHDALQAPVAVDPGRHVVSVQRDGADLARQEIALGEGEARTVAIEVAPRVVAALPVAVAVAPDATALDAPRDEGGGDDTWIWVGVGIGAVVAIGVAVGIAVAVTSSESGPLYEGNLGDGMVRF